MLLESIGTQNPLFGVVPTVHPNLPRMMSHDATRAALRKRSVFVRCSGVVSDTSEMGFQWISYEGFTKLVSVFCFFQFGRFLQFFQRHRGPVKTSLCNIHYASLLASTKTADTKQHVALKQICTETLKYIYNSQAPGSCTMPSMWVLLPFLVVPAYGIAFTSKAQLRAAVVDWEANTERLP